MTSVPWSLLRATDSVSIRGTAETIFYNLKLFWRCLGYSFRFSKLGLFRYRARYTLSFTWIKRATLDTWSGPIYKETTMTSTRSGRSVHQIPTYPGIPLKNTGFIPCNWYRGRSAVSYCMCQVPATYWERDKSQRFTGVTHKRNHVLGLS